MTVIVSNRARYLAARVDSGTRMAVQKAANQIFLRSKNIVPVDTGALKGSARTKPATGAFGVYSAEVSFEQPYALFVEWGTSKMAPQPYLVPATHAVKPQLESDLKRLIGAL